MIEYPFVTIRYVYIVLLLSREIIINTKKIKKIKILPLMNDLKNETAIKPPTSVMPSGFRLTLYKETQM